MPVCQGLFVILGVKNVRIQIDSVIFMWREQVWKKLFTGFLHLFTIVQINKYEKLK